MHTHIHKHLYTQLHTYIHTFTHTNTYSPTHLIKDIEKINDDDVFEGKVNYVRIVVTSSM